MLRRLRSSAERAQLLFAKQTLPSLALVGTRAEGNFPGVWRRQASRDQLLPHVGLRLIARLGMAKEEHVPQLDRPAAVVLGELILVKLRERCRQTLLHLTGKRHTPILPVNGDELGELVSTLDDAGKRLGHKGAVRLVASHLSDEKKWRMTQLHPLASFDCQRRHLLGRDLGNEFGNAAGNLDSVLIKLAFPKQARQHRAAQLQLRRNVSRGSALVRASSKVKIH
jgi:hypothetical protein